MQKSVGASWRSPYHHDFGNALYQIFRKGTICKLHCYVAILPFAVSCHGRLLAAEQSSGHFNADKALESSSCLQRPCKHAHPHSQQVLSLPGLLFFCQLTGGKAASSVDLRSCPALRSLGFGGENRPPHVLGHSTICRTSCSLASARLAGKPVSSLCRFRSDALSSRLSSIRGNRNGLNIRTIKVPMVPSIAGSCVFYDRLCTRNEAKPLLTQSGLPRKNRTNHETSLQKPPQCLLPARNVRATTTIASSGALSIQRNPFQL